MFADWRRKRHDELDMFHCTSMTARRGIMTFETVEEPSNLSGCEFSRLAQGPDSTPPLSASCKVFFSIKCAPAQPVRPLLENTPAAGLCTDYAGKSIRPGTQSGWSGAADGVRRKEPEKMESETGDGVMMELTPFASVLGQKEACAMLCLDSEGHAANGHGVGKGQPGAYDKTCKSAK